MANHDKYHNLFFPSRDVYDLAGTDVFLRLSNKTGNKNAILISDSELDKMSNDSPGGKDALEHLSDKKFTLNDGYIVYSVDSGLDVIVGSVKNEGVKRYGDPLVLTLNPANKIQSQIEGFNVEKPEFLLASASIVEEGIIEGNFGLEARLYESSPVTIENAESLLGRELYPNQFIRFRPMSGDEKNKYARVVGETEISKDQRPDEHNNVEVRLLDKIEYSKTISLGGPRQSKILGIGPNDMEQYIACQYGILNPEVEIAFLSGEAGTGKTILSYALGVSLTMSSSQKEMKSRTYGGEGKITGFKNLVLLKPTDLLGGRDVGFLPGNLLSKLGPHLTPYEHAHKITALNKFAFSQMFLHPKRETEYGPMREEIARIDGAFLNPEGPAIELCFSGFMRGYSFTDTLVLVDEAQNFTPYEMKSLITRLGPGSKAIVMGDPNQFDNPKCSRDLNGFTYSIKHFMHEDQSSLVKLPTSYRSKIAEAALSMRAYA